MRCKVGVHTGRIVLKFTEHDWANARMALGPATIGHRSWVIMERGGCVVASRSQFGTAPHRLTDRPNEVILQSDTGTIVRCETHEREATFPRAGQIQVEMPPHHLWPWLTDGRSRLRRTTPDKWRWHLVQELNARIKSATAAGEDFPLDYPDWVRKMLTPDELFRLRYNNEIVR